jgi:LSD1 subclass zinc finger protein
METGKIPATTGIKCANCGAILVYAPGIEALQCSYCGTENRIDAIVPARTDEIDYAKFLSATNLTAEQCRLVHTVACKACGATTTLAPNTAAASCPFCDTALIVQQAQTTTIIKPRYLLPFKIDIAKAGASFRFWAKKRWFAPGDLKRWSETADRLNGVYIPYWTYDAATSSDYHGERGANHTESYTAVENGKSVRRTRSTIRWVPVSGHVRSDFDDVLILATRSLPEKYANKLDPWDLANLAEYNEHYLSGFRAETYQVDLPTGFEKAKNIMEISIREAIRRDIGGDHQRIRSLKTSYGNVTFKHILLPIWISAYRYHTKVYRFMVNGRTGEVQGERPWSWAKITLAILGGMALAAAIYFGYHELQPLMTR